MSIFERIVEQKILAAQQEGQFNHLSGAGKPLDLGENPYIPEGCELAYHVLKEQGFTLPWIEDGNELDQEIQSARQELARRLSACQSRAEIVLIRNEFQSVLSTLNRRILSYNLRVPSVHFQRKILDLESEWLSAIGSQDHPHQPTGSPE